MQKRHCAESVHRHCIVDRFGQVWSCCFDISGWITTKLHTRTENFLGRFLSPFRSARLIGSGGNSLLSRLNWHKVWTGVKCNFSSAQLHDRYTVGRLRLAEFEREISPGYNVRQKSYGFRYFWHQTLSEQPGFGSPPKTCELPLFFAAIGQAVRRWKALDLGSLNRHLMFFHLLVQ